ncbi:UNVERIFIED_CONTAM: Protein TAR1 [Sesamum indicum]
MDGAEARDLYPAVGARARPPMSRRARRSPQNPGREPRAERPSVRILVVVANIQMRTLKAEEGKVDPKGRGKPDRQRVQRVLRKGIGLKFLNRDAAADGNVRESGDVGRGASGRPWSYGTDVTTRSRIRAAGAHRTPRDVRALPAAGPYLRLSQKITLPEAPADVSGLPNVAVSRRVPCRSHGTFPLFGLQSSHLNICYYHQDPHRRPLRPGSRPGFCGDRRALLLIGAWPLPRRPGIGRALQRHPFSGLVDSAGMLTRTLLRRSRSVGVAPLGGDRAGQLPYALRVCSPVDSHTCQTPWSVFQDGSNGEPAGQRRERAVAEARRGRALSATIGATAFRGHIDCPGFGRRLNPRWSAPRADRRTGSRRSTSDRGASPAPIRFPPDNFKHSLTLFSKSFSSFPRGTCSLSVSRPYLALDGIYRPIGAAFPNNPTRRQRLVVRQGPGTTGLSPSPAPLSRGLGPGPPLRTLLQTTIRTAKPPDSQVGLFPVRSPLLGESL